MGCPTYTFGGKNVVGIGAFKSYFGLWFFQGALLTDPQNVLVNCQEGRTKAMRQWRMNSDKEIKPTIIKAYVAEAIEMVKAGKEIKPDRRRPVVIPDELKAALSRNKQVDSQYQKLTLGKRREYADYIASAKKAETKQQRLKKILPMIAKGVGLNDKYRTG